MIVGARLTVGKKTFQPIAMDHQMAPLAGNERIAFELYQKFRYPRTRSAHQVSKILMSRGNCQTCSAFFLDAKILAQLEQNQRPLTVPVLLTWSRENRGASAEDAVGFLRRLKEGEMYVFVASLPMAAIRSGGPIR